MSTFLLEKDRWQSYFDNLSGVMEIQVAQLEIVSKEIGDQPQASGLTLNGVTYDPKNDLLELQLSESMEHLIQSPQEIYVTEDSNGLSSMEVTDKSGIRHILTLNT